MRPNKETPPFRLELNPSSGVPLYRQIVEGIKSMVAASVLKPGDQLPSIRELSAGLRINPSSAVKAYSELQHEKVIALDHGRGTFVSSDPQVVTRSRDALLERHFEALLQQGHLLGYSDEDVLTALAAHVRRRGKGGGRKA